MPLVSRSRRNVLTAACCGVGFAGAWMGWAGHARAADTGHVATDLTPTAALQRLKDGNARFVDDKRRHVPIVDRKRRLQIASAQSPFAVLVGCSDSRVSPEHLFGVGLGELFIVRNAGNTVDTAALGSIEYGIHELGVPLIVVLGHERCGAVSAALQVVQKNQQFSGAIGPLVEPIIPAVLQARSENATLQGAALLDACVRQNVRRVVDRLRSGVASLQVPQRDGKLKIVGARYDLDDGGVDFFLQDA